MKIQIVISLFFIALIGLGIQPSLGQTTAPVISYTAPSAYTINTAITPLTPTISGSPSTNGGFGASFTLAGGGSPGGIASGSANGTGTSATFYNPYGLALDGNGNLFVGDYSNNKIRKIVISTRVVSTVAGSGVRGYKNGIGSDANFTWTWGIATDTLDNLYLGDTGANLISKISPAGYVSRFAGGGNGISSGYVDGVDSLAIFWRPTGIARDQAGNVYVADYGNQRIRKISAGIVSTFAGTGNYAVSLPTNDATGTNAIFSYPSGLTYDGNGNLYVTNTKSGVTGYNYIQKINIATQVV